MPEVIYLHEFGTKNSDALLTAFHDHLRASGRADRSVASYAGEVRRFTAWIAAKYGEFNPAAVSALDVVEYREHLQSLKGRKDRPLAPATVNKALASLRVFFGWLKETGQARENPAAGIKNAAVGGTTAPRWLDRRQQAALVHAVQAGGSLRDMAIFGLMLHAGLRIGEVCALERGDIEISERKGLVRVHRGKGNKYREVPLNKTARKMLAAWLEKNPDGSLFPNRYGQPISVFGVEKLFREYAYQAKLENVTPHCLRHTFCKNLIDMGVPIDQVAMLAGHSGLDTTKRYTAPSMADLQAAVDRVAWE